MSFCNREEKINYPFKVEFTALDDKNAFPSLSMVFDYHLVCFTRFLGFSFLGVRATSAHESSVIASTSAPGRVGAQGF